MRVLEIGRPQAWDLGSVGRAVHFVGPRDDILVEKYRVGPAKATTTHTATPPDPHSQRDTAPCRSNRNKSERVIDEVACDVAKRHHAGGQRISRCVGR